MDLLCYHRLQLTSASLYRTIGAMVWRFIWTHEYRNNPDFPSYLGRIGIVSTLELWLGIIVANIPTLAPLFRPGRFERHPGPKQSQEPDSRGSQAPIQLRSLQDSRTTRGVGGGGYDRIYGGRDSFLESRSDEESHLVKPAGALAVTAVTAECAYDPHARHPGSMLAPDAIYVRTNIN